MNFFLICKQETVKLFFMLLISVCLYSCGNQNRTGSQTGKNDSANSGSGTGTDKKEINLSDDFIINYDLEGKLKGKMIIYRSGEKLKQEMNTEIMGVKSLSSIFIIDKNVYSVIDIQGTKMGTKTDLSTYNSKKQTGETITNFSDFEKFLDSKKISGTENILGYNCDIYDISNNVTLCVYDKRYILKIKAPDFLATATSLNTSPSFSPTEFEIPKDVSFNSMDMKDLNKKNLDSLVNKFKQ